MTCVAYDTQGRPKSHDTVEEMERECSASTAPIVNRAEQIVDGAPAVNDGASVARACKGVGGRRPLGSVYQNVHGAIVRQYNAAADDKGHTEVVKRRAHQAEPARGASERDAWT